MRQLNEGLIAGAVVLSTSLVHAETLTQDEIAFAFDATAPGELAALSGDEMRETEGAAWLLVQLLLDPPRPMLLPTDTITNPWLLNFFTQFNGYLKGAIGAT